MKRNTDIVSVISEPGALTFVTRKEWQSLPEKDLETLSQYEIVIVFNGTESVFFLLRNNHPENLFAERNAYKLVRVTTDEDGKQVFYMVDLSRAEGEQIRQNAFELWG